MKLILGRPGQGKTRSAIEVAIKKADSYSNVLFLSEELGVYDFEKRIDTMSSNRYHWKMLFKDVSGLPEVLAQIITTAKSGWVVIVDASPSIRKGSSLMALNALEKEMGIEVYAVVQVGRNVNQENVEIVNYPLPEDSEILK